MAVASPDLDSRHFGVRCRLARKAGRPTIEPDLDRTIESCAEVDEDDLNELMRNTIDGLTRAANGAAKKKFYETIAGQNAPASTDPNKIQLAIDPRAHSMDNYMAHVLFEFEQHTALMQGKEDAALPFSAGPVERMERYYFRGHYFSKQRFWGDRPEDVDIKASDGVLVLW